MDRGLVFNIQRYCLHDGPGIRTTVFLEGLPAELQLVPQSGKSAAGAGNSGDGVAVCPLWPLPRGVSPGRAGGSASGFTACRGATRARLETQRPIIRADCTLCGACVAACPTGARQMVGREMTVDEVVAEVLHDRMFHDQSGGGVTLSGGEPLSQAPFVLRLLQALRRRSIHTALDTSGFAPRQVILDVAPWVDLFLYDLKSVDDRGPSRADGGLQCPDSREPEDAGGHSC